MEARPAPDDGPAWGAAAADQARLHQAALAVIAARLQAEDPAGLGGVHG